MVKYTLGRLGLFLVVLLLVLPISVLSLPMKLLVALVVSFPLSWFLLRGWRDRASADLAAWVERRRAEKARLRAALAGEDEAGPPDQQPNRPQNQPNDLPRGRSESPQDPQDQPSDQPSDPAQDLPRGRPENPQDPQDQPSDPPGDLPQDLPRGRPENPQDLLKDPPRGRSENPPDQPPGRPEDKRRAG